MVCKNKKIFWFPKISAVKLFLVTALAILPSTTLLVPAKSNAQVSDYQSRARFSGEWTVEQILSELKPMQKLGRKPKYCQGAFFAPCVCPNDVNRSIQYRPAVTECDGNAAVILSGRYLNSFSAVVRDGENRDRWPREGMNGCSAFERDVLALNKCSAFKAQKVLNVASGSRKAKVHCLGASGYSSLFRGVTRITVKLADSPNSSNDPLARLCLRHPTRALN
jgi:hypothetical protein